MINQMEEIGFPGESEIGFSGESSEIAFSESEMEAAKQLMQLSEDDTLSCSSGTGTAWSVSACEGDYNTKRQETVVSSMVGEEQNDGVWRINNKNVTDGRRFMKAITETKALINKKKQKKLRSLASIYRATKEMTRG
ncbi:hypothetical protein CARUB_v10006579mg [Capsella rubella]|uniref:Uncharacterized protein n=1 Tax=Capsella rubella TaxID=81985 RepID=R0H3L5_9BRAS|nr:uncharacterized protein LOC17879799 [Capsella rubella]EOA18118.1 hypothetical protein CARUB_v10006579mg [Capsella rubella]